MVILISDANLSHAIYSFLVKYTIPIVLKIFFYLIVLDPNLIQPAENMLIHADPDPKHWLNSATSLSSVLCGCRTLPSKGLGSFAEAARETFTDMAAASTSSLGGERKASDTSLRYLTGVTGPLG